jgi:hypothetical protein
VAEQVLQQFLPKALKHGQALLQALAVSEKRAWA